MLFSRLKDLWFKSCRDYKIMMLALFLRCVVYFALMSILMIWLKDDVKMSNREAGWLYSLWGVCISIASLLFGSVIDYLWVKKTMILHIALICTSHMLLAFFRSNIAVWLIMLGPMALALGIGAPVIGISIRRYIPSTHQSAAFGVRYTIVNIGALVGENVVEIFRLKLMDVVEERYGDAWVYGSFHLCIACVYAVVVVLVIVFVRDVEYFEDMENRDPHMMEMSILSTTEADFDFYETDDEANEHSNDTLQDEDDVSTVELLGNPVISPLSRQKFDTKKRDVKKWEIRYIRKPRQKHGEEQVKKSWRQKFADLKAAIKNRARDIYFWKFIGFALCMTGVQMGLKAFTSIYPDYMRRAPFNVDDPEDVPFLLFLGLDPLIAVLLATPMAAILARTGLNLFQMIAMGTIISGISPFFMLFVQSMFPLAHRFPTLVTFVQYASVILFICVYAVGETMWAPQFDTYSFYFAEKGKEGIFFALATLPMFFSKAVTGVLAGELLEAFCQTKGSGCDTTGIYIWLIIGMTTLSTCILLMSFQNKLTITDRNRNGKEEVEF